MADAASPIVGRMCWAGNDIAKSAVLFAQLSGFFGRRRLPRLRTSRIVWRRRCLVLAMLCTPNTSGLRPVRPQTPSPRQCRPRLPRSPSGERAGVRGRHNAESRPPLPSPNLSPQRHHGTKHLPSGERDQHSGLRHFSTNQRPHPKLDLQHRLCCIRRHKDPRPRNSSPVLIKSRQAIQR
jgi:hypothetical protein